MCNNKVNITKKGDSIIMKDAIQEQFLSIVTAAVETGKDVVEFAMDQAPLLVQEILRFAVFEHSFGVIVSLLTLFAIYKAWKFVAKHWESIESECAEPFVFVFGIMGSLIGGSFVVIHLFISAASLAKVLLAPRLYLIEYAASLVR